MNNNYFNYNFNNPNPFIRNQMINPNMYQNFRAPIPRISNFMTQTRSPNILSQLIPKTALPNAVRTQAISSIAPKLSFTQILNGTSKTLGVINQAIPVFYQAKPIWKNAKTMFRVVKELNNKEPVPNIKKETTNQTEKIEKNINQTKTQKKESDDSPTFFI